MHGPCRTLEKIIHVYEMANTKIIVLTFFPLKRCEAKTIIQFTIEDMINKKYLSIMQH